jgi:hypothetical protein
MKKILTGLTILISFSLYAQQTTDNASNIGGPKIQTVSGIVRGVAEGNVESFKEFHTQHLRLENIAGDHHNLLLHGRESLMQVSLEQVVRRLNGVPLPEPFRRVRRKIACS